MLTFIEYVLFFILEFHCLHLYSYYNVHVQVFDNSRTWATIVDWSGYTGNCYTMVTQSSHYSDNSSTNLPDVLNFRFHYVTSLKEFWGVSGETDTWRGTGQNYVTWL